MKTKKNILISLLLVIVCHSAFSGGQDSTETTSDNLVYTFDITRKIDATAWRYTQKAMDKASSQDADLVIIHMNTYGGQVLAADSIRTKILSSEIPVYVFIDNNAASAGALISIACDSIYMASGASMGAATVVNREGKPMPDKYQSYMRSTIRATAEAQGKDTVIRGQDTVVKWRRDPKIAEAMVDPNLKVQGVSDSGKVVTFTPSEAIANNYCEGTAKSIKEVIQKSGLTNYEKREYTPSTMDTVMGFLSNPAFQSFFIMMIIGGIYFELQSPGIGFALGIAVLGALLYFAPLYLEGLAENWEILLFVVGLVFVAAEIFAIPGFGVAGVTGIILIITGLTLSLVESYKFTMPGGFAEQVLKSLFMVVFSMVVALVLSIYLANKLLTTKTLRFVTLQATQQKDEGYVAVEKPKDEMKGKKGEATTDLHPAGKVLIDDEEYDAQAIVGFIENGTEVVVVKYESGRVHVRPAK